MSRLTRDRTPELYSRDQILRRERGQGNIHFPCSADLMCDHTYTVTTFSRVDQPGMVADPARGQLNRGFFFFSCPGSGLRTWPYTGSLSEPSSITVIHDVLYKMCESIKYSSGTQHNAQYCSVRRKKRHNSRYNAVWHYTGRSM